MKRLPPKALYAIPEKVLELDRRFQYPDMDTINPLTQPGGGGGMPTVVVAASDASDLSKSKADYVCSGGNDQSVIGEALSVLPTSPRTMGRLVFTEGTFTLVGGTSSDIFDVSNQRWIQGSGKGSTRIYIAGNATTTGRVIFDIRGGSTISDLRIEREPTTVLDANSYAAIGMFGELTTVRSVEIVEVGGSSGTVQTAIWSGNGLANINLEEVYIRDSPSDSIHMQANNHVVMRAIHVVDAGRNGVSLAGGCTQITLAQSTIDSTSGDAVYSESTNNLVITGNQLHADTGWGVNLADDQNGWVTIAGNDFYRCDSGAVFVQGGYDVGVIGNQITGSPFFDTNPAIYYTDGSGGGTTYYGGTVVGNTISSPNATGILLDDYNDCVIADNIIRNEGADAANTYDGISIDGNDNLVHGNWIQSFDLRYGLNIVGGNNNAVYANYLGDSSNYGTADSIDSGTATQLTPAAGAIGGQFAY